MNLIRPLCFVDLFGSSLGSKVFLLSSDDDGPHLCFGGGHFGNSLGVHFVNKKYIFSSLD